MDNRGRISRNYWGRLLVSVLVSKRRESKLEVLVHAIRLQQELTKLIQRNFGIRDIHRIVRRKYAFGKEKTENYEKYIVKVSGTYKYLQVKYQLNDRGRIIKRINPDRITAMRRKLKKLAVKYRDGEVEYSHVEDTFKSWMGSFYKDRKSVV